MRISTVSKWLRGWCLVVIFLGLASTVEAATLRLSPATGVHTLANTFAVSVLVDTQGEPINAAEGTLSFNPKQLEVVSVSRANSIFNLWTVEPAYSNAAGTVSFGGGSPSGYTGGRGRVITISFRSLSAGDPKVRFTDGSILAADGQGTNVLTSMNGGTYTIRPASNEPAPEYVPAADTPAAPKIKSTTHPNATAWYQKSTAKLAWDLPAGITAARTLLDQSPSSVPSKVYEPPISEITLEDLEEGESYLHLQFKNEAGWGRVSHYRLGIDTQNPEKIEITQPAEADRANPEQTLAVKVKDATSGVAKYQIAIDKTEPISIPAPTSGLVTLPPLEPGHHNLIIEAFDKAGNSIVGTYSLKIEAFSSPRFTEYPTRLNAGVIPVIKGKTRPNVNVLVTITKTGNNATAPIEYQLTSDEKGSFVLVPEGDFSPGIYELVAVAAADDGAKSQPSTAVRMVVEKPGYILIGSLLISVLSIAIPLLALVGLLIIMVVYFGKRLKTVSSTVTKETDEALASLKSEFANLKTTLETAATDLKASKKSKKLSKGEETLVATMDAVFKEAEDRIEKEVAEVDDIVKPDKK